MSIKINKNTKNTQKSQLIIKKIRICPDLLNILLKCRYQHKIWCNSSKIDGKLWALSWSYHWQNTRLQDFLWLRWLTRALALARWYGLDHLITPPQVGAYEYLMSNLGIVLWFYDSSLGSVVMKLAKVVCLLDAFHSYPHRGLHGLQQWLLAMLLAALARALWLWLSDVVLLIQLRSWLCVFVEVPSLLSTSWVTWNPTNGLCLWHWLLWHGLCYSGSGWFWHDLWHSKYGKAIGNTPPQVRVFDYWHIRGKSCLKNYSRPKVFVGVPSLLFTSGATQNPTIVIAMKLAPPPLTLWLWIELDVPLAHALWKTAHGWTKMAPTRCSFQFWIGQCWL